MLASVEHAVTDARDAVLAAEQKHAAGVTAVRGAEKAVQEAREVLARLERLRDRMALDTDI